MQPYTVKSPIKYDGKRREVGEILEIEPKHAKTLLAAGAIEPAAKAAGPGDRTPTDQELLGLLDQPIPKIVEIISLRDGDGNPRAPAEDLRRLRKAEENGKTRSTLIAAIDAELAAREAPQS